MANTNTNDIDLLLMDSNDDQLTEEIMRDKVRKESFLAMIESATTGGDFLSIVNLLPNSSQRYGHSLTMNAIIKIICQHSTFKDRCTGFYTTKVKAGKEAKVVSTYNMLGSNESSSLAAVKETKIIVERKLLCLKEQIEFQKYVLMSECFDGEEKKKQR
jgi:hypothetical protein